MSDIEENVCLARMKEVTGDNPVLKCTKCNNLYHIGKCSGVTKKAKNAVNPLTWLCTTCKLNTQRHRQQGDDQIAQATAETSDHGQAAIMAQISAQHETTMQKLDNQEKTIESIEKSANLLSKQYDDLIKKMDSLTTVTNDLRKKTKEIEQLALDNDVRIKDLEWAVENMEQYSQRRNIEIHGISPQVHEDLPTILKNLAARLELPSPEPDKIETMHRLKAARDDKIAPIIVRFNDRSERDRWISKRTALKADHIFINENLTKLQKWLFRNAKECARERGYSFVWMRNGKILVRQRAGSAVIRIDREDDLNKIR
ncbi:unnamed protein product [Ixodes persulcatus]